MDIKSPFGYPIETYIWVIGLACIAGAIKNINAYASSNTKAFSFIILLKDILTGGLSGLMAFWLCEYYEVKVPLNAVIISITGIMGARAWDEVEDFIKSLSLIASKIKQQPPRE